MTAARIRELGERGYCVLRGHFPHGLVERCRDSFWAVLRTYLELHAGQPNRGPHRHYLPMPFERPSFAAEFFEDAGILAVVRGAMGDRVVADEWGCEVPLRGSEYQQLHADYRRALFEEAPGLELPPYMLVVNFGLVPISTENGPMEIVPGTHRMAREQALEAARRGDIALERVLLDAGDVLIRHPWALHRGSPNMTDIPRAMASIRYVRRWYTDGSREVNPIPAAVWESLTPAQQSLMRFPIAGNGRR